MQASAQRVHLTQAIQAVRENDTLMNRFKLYEVLSESEVVLPGVDRGNGNQPVTITNPRGEVGIIVFSGKQMISAWDSDTSFVLRNIAMKDLCSIALGKSMEAVIIDPTKTGGVILRKWEMECFARSKLPIERGKTWNWVQVAISSGAQICVRHADPDTVARCALDVKRVLQNHQIVKRGLLFNCFFEPVNEPEQLAVGIEPIPGANKEQALELNNELLGLNLKSDTGLPLKVVFITNTVSLDTAIENSNVLYER